MRKLGVLVVVFFHCVTSAAAQHAILASRAINHIGEKSVVIDSVFAIKTLNDTTVSIILGQHYSNVFLQLILRDNLKYKIDRAALSKYKFSIIEARGLIIIDGELPTMIITDREALYLYTHASQKNWLTAALK